MKGLPWRIVEDALGGYRKHCVPVEDDREHAASQSCWCTPEQDHESPELWHHHSVDNREAYERGERRVS